MSVVKSERTVGEDFSYLTGVLYSLVFDKGPSYSDAMWDGLFAAAKVVRAELDRIPGLELAVKELQLIQTAEPLREYWGKLPPAPAEFVREDPRAIAERLVKQDETVVTLMGTFCFPVGVGGASVDVVVEKIRKMVCRGIEQGQPQAVSHAVSPRKCALREITQVERQGPTFDVKTGRETPPPEMRQWIEENQPDAAKAARDQKVTDDVAKGREHFKQRESAHQERMELEALGRRNGDEKRDDQLTCGKHPTQVKADEHAMPECPICGIPNNRVGNICARCQTTDAVNRDEALPVCFFCHKEATKEASFATPKQGNIRVCRECRLIVGSDRSRNREVS